MSTPITEITGIGPSTAATLSEHGFHSAEDIATTTVDALCSVPGFGPIKAKASIAAAQSLAPAKPSTPKKPKKKDKPKAKAKKKSGKSTKSDKKDKRKKSDKKTKTKEICQAG